MAERDMRARAFDPPSRRRPSTGTLVAVALVAGLTLLNATWLVGNRADGPFDIDEAGYLTQGTAATADMQAGNILRGPVDLWRSSASGPLLPELTITGQLVFGRTTATALLVNLSFFVVLGAATYLLARRWLERRWALLALAVTLTAPGLTSFARTYVFALAAAATFTLAIGALVRSDRFARRPLALTFGIALGLTVLTRTIMLAFVPGLVAAGALAWWQNPPEVRRRVRGNVALAAGAALLVAGSWYVFSTRAVLRYLLDFGYGEASVDYGDRSVSSASFWLADVADVVGRELYLPLTIVLGIGTVVGVTSWSRHAGPQPARRVLRSEAMVAATPIALGFVALLTSRNTGNGFTLPLIPAAVVLATMATRRIEVRTPRTGLAVALCSVMALNLVMMSGLVPAFGTRRSAWDTDLVALTIVDGRSNIERYLAEETPYPLDDDGHVPTLHEGWLDAARVTRDELHAAGALPGATHAVVAVEGPLYNLNLVALVGELDGEVPLRLTGFDSSIGGAQGDVAAALQAEAEGGTTALVTGPASLSWDDTGLALDTIETGAEQAGFTRSGEVVLPDGQTVTVWAAPA